MDSIPSPTEMHALIISFNEIALGAPISTATHFLQEGKWRIEDALEMFYASSEVEVPNSASSSTPETRVPDSTSIPTMGSSGLPEFVTRRRQRSHAQIAADAAAGASPSVHTDYITCRRRRTRAEMTMDVASTATNPLPLTSSSRGARRPRHPTTKVTSDSIDVGNEAISLVAETPPDKVVEHRPRRRRRTRAQMTSAEQMLIPPSTSPLFPSVSLEPHVIQNNFINTPSFFENPMSSTESTQTGPLPEVADVVPTRTVPRPRRTRLELDVAFAPTGVSTYSKSYSVHRAQPTVGLGP